MDLKQFREYLVTIMRWNKNPACVAAMKKNSGFKSYILKQTRAIFQMSNISEDDFNSGQYTDQLSIVEDTLKTLAEMIQNDQVDFPIGDSVTEEMVASFKEMVITAAGSYNRNIEEVDKSMHKPASVVPQRVLEFPDEKFSRALRNDFQPIDELFPNGGPKMEDVVQTSDHACFLLAPLASIAANKPEMIKNMMHDYGDSVGVTFYGLVEDPNQPGKMMKAAFEVSVSKTTIGMDSKSAPWVHIMEKAYAASRLRSNAGMIRVTDRDVPNGSISVKEELDGGSPELTISTFTPTFVDGAIDKEQNKILEANTKQECHDNFYEYLWNASNAGNILYMDTDSHVISIKNITKENDKYILNYYDQASDHEMKSVNLDDILGGKFNNGSGDVRRIHVDSLDGNQFSDMQVFHVRRIKSKIDELEALEHAKAQQEQDKDEEIKTEEIQEEPKADENIINTNSNQANANLMQEQPDQNQLGQNQPEVGPYYRENPYSGYALASEAESVADYTNLAGSFRDKIQALKDGKTRFNSSEYKDLINLVEHVSDSGAIKGTENLSDMQRYVAKLCLIKKQINKYLRHKAKNGVKQNVYGKLAAVEDLNREITARLAAIDVPVDKFGLDGKTINLENLKKKLTYEDEVTAAKKKNPEVNALKLMTNDELDGAWNAALEKYPAASRYNVELVDDCMCRIILKAEKKGYSAATLEEHLNIRKSFQENPAKKVVTAEKEAQPVQPQMQEL